MDIMNIVYAMLVLGVMGAVFGGLLAFAAKIFYVEQDPRIGEVREALAGANCGGCGYAGCDAYAAAVVAGEAPPNKCSPGGAATAEKVAAIMGLDAAPEVKYVAFVPCSGNADAAKLFFDYDGPKDCVAAMRFGNKGPKECQFSCIGLGNCVRACKLRGQGRADPQDVRRGLHRLHEVPEGVPARGHQGRELRRHHRLRQVHRLRPLC